MCVRASMKAAKPLHIVLATNPNPTRARGYPLNINPKPDPKPDSISGPAGSGRVATSTEGLANRLECVNRCNAGCCTLANSCDSLLAYIPTGCFQQEQSCSKLLSSQIYQSLINSSGLCL